VSHDAEPVVDPDVDLHVPEQRRELSATPLRVIAVIAAGGAIGALSRYGVLLLLPTVPGRFPWGTFTINVVGCALIGVLMVLVTEVFTDRPLLRPFVGVGILGGFTTFSTYANETRALLRPGSVPIAAAYLAGTLLCALLAVIAGMALTHAVRDRRTPTAEAGA
jgi:CrcB protein